MPRCMREANPTLGQKLAKVVTQHPELGDNATQRVK